MLCMNKKTKRERILEELKGGERRVVPELARMLDFPISTVRWHLMVLASEGKIKRIKLSPRMILWEFIEEQ